MTKLSLKLSAVAAILVAATPVWAQEVVDPANADVANSGDTAWILTATALVLLMTLPGLALFLWGFGTVQELPVRADPVHGGSRYLLDPLGCGWLHTRIRAG